MNDALNISKTDDRAAGRTSSRPGRIALVTGASSGIGAAVAKVLAANGATVLVNHPPGAESERKAAAVVQDIAENGGTAVTACADVSNEAQVDAMVARTVERFGGLDLLVSNAGIERRSPIHQMTLSDWQAVIDVNLTGAFLCARAAARHFLSRDEPSHGGRGNIIFTSSVHEFIPWAFQSNYAASKGGVMLLMKSLAQELAPAGIRVNSVAPGAIATPINAASRDTAEELQGLLKLIPSGRVGEPVDVANAVLWLASDASAYVTGTSLVVDGGMSLYPAFRGGG